MLDNKIGFLLWLRDDRKIEKVTVQLLASTFNVRVDRIRTLLAEHDIFEEYNCTVPLAQVIASLGLDKPRKRL